MEVCKKPFEPFGNCNCCAVLWSALPVSNWPKCWRGELGSLSAAPSVAKQICDDSFFMLTMLRESQI